MIFPHRHIPGEFFIALSNASIDPTTYQDLRFNNASTVIAKHVLLPNSKCEAGLDLSRGLVDLYGKVADITPNDLNLLTVSTGASPDQTTTGSLSGTPSSVASATSATPADPSASVQSVRFCGSRGMRPCPAGQECILSSKGKLSFVQDFPGQCEIVEGPDPGALEP
ncbi:MAG: hypothetical protein Q9172_005741 [Xanthocarpia lactea]